MLFFLIIYFIVFALYYSLHERSIWFILLILLLLVCFRGDEVGSDFLSYVHKIEIGYYDISIEQVKSWFSTHQYFEKDEYGTNAGAMREFGFSLYLTILNGVFNNPRLTINLTVIIIMLIYLLAFRKLCKSGMYICLFIYISTYMFYSSFNTLRQSFAVSFILLSCIYMYMKQYIRAILMGLIACTIHFATVLAFPICVIAYCLRINKKVALFILLILLFFFLAKIEVPFLINLLSDNVAGRDIQEGFVEGKRLAYNVYIFYLSFVFQGMMIYVFYWFYSNSNGQYSFFYNLWFIGIVIYLLLMSSPNVGRFSEYFYVFQIVAMTLTLLSLKENDYSKYVVGNQMLLIYCVIWYSFYALRNFYGLQPYISFK